jgi:HD-GYP domain-containing protein (c-di-GMP phosphodiesterase class II)
MDGRINVSMQFRTVDCADKRVSGGCPDRPTESSTLLRVSIKNAMPGMKLALPLLHPERGTVLLAEGYVLQETLVRKLQQLGIRDFWIEYPDTDQIKQYVSPHVLQEQSSVIETVAQMFDAVHRDAYADLEFNRYYRTLQGLIEALVIQPTAASYIVELGGSAESDLRHASEVAFLSILLGLKLQGYLVQQRKRLRPKDARDVVSLGLGALLHDIGMSSLSTDVRRRFELTRDESDSQWRRHVDIGHRLVSGSVPPAAAGVVRHHHQHFDGSGFPTSLDDLGRPRGLTGEDIHIFARIVCVANHFDRLRYPGDGSVQPRIRVLKSMMSGPIATRFDPIVLGALPLVVPAFPPGSMVTLNTGEKAVVVQWHPEAPCQPIVQVLSPNALMMPHSPQIDRPALRYDLRERCDLCIIEHDGIDVSNDGFRHVAAAGQSQKNAA